MPAFLSITWMFLVTLAGKVDAQTPQKYDCNNAGREKRQELATTLCPVGNSKLVFADSVGFRTVLKNLGRFTEATYQVGGQVDGGTQTLVTNRNPITPGERDFSVGRVPGDTLYNFIIPNELIVGIAKMGPSHKIVLTSSGQSSITNDDNKFIVTDMYGNILDSSHYQTSYYDLDWNGRWLLTSDGPLIRRIDTSTFTAIVPPIWTSLNLSRGIGSVNYNRIWATNYHQPICLFDTVGIIIRTLGIPPCCPYGLAFDRWTSTSRSWLWYTQPSTSGIYRLSKVDTSTAGWISSPTIPIIRGVLLPSW